MDLLITLATAFLAVWLVLVLAGAVLGAAFFIYFFIESRR